MSNRVEKQLQVREIQFRGVLTVLEISPILLASDRQRLISTVIEKGGVSHLIPTEQYNVTFGTVDLATNAEIQALIASLANPNIRIIATIAEGFYRLVGRRSSGIRQGSDLRGKRIGLRYGLTSSSYYLEMLLKTYGIASSEVEIVSFNEPRDLSHALINRQIDAMTVWEPEPEVAANRISDDLVQLQPFGINPESFILATTVDKLGDPDTRAQIVHFLRAVWTASAEINQDPALAWSIIKDRSGYDPKILQNAWRHLSFPIGKNGDELLDVLADVETWMAAKTDRAARSRCDLKNLIDLSIQEEVLQQIANNLECGNGNDR